MTKPTEVSVIIIFLNEEKLLGDAIQSVMAQTHDSWELLLVDDGSTDGSPSLARGWARQHPERIRYLEHEGHSNRGMSASRNHGIRNARGRYIAFLDADDLWLPRKLTEQIAIMEANPQAGMVCGTSIYCYNWEPEARGNREEVPTPVGAPPDTLIMPPALLTTLYPLAGGMAPCPSDLLLRMEAVQKVGGFEENFRGDHQLYEDQAFLSKIYLTSPVYISSKALDYYRIRSSSCVARVTREGKYDVVRRAYLEWFEKYLQSHGVNDSAVWKAVRRALFPYRRPRLAAARHRFGAIASGGRMLLSRIVNRVAPGRRRGWRFPQRARMD